MLRCCGTGTCSQGGQWAECHKAEGTSPTLRHGCGESWEVWQAHTIQHDKARWSLLAGGALEERTTGDNRTTVRSHGTSGLGGSFQFM